MENSAHRTAHVYTRGADMEGNTYIVVLGLQMAGTSDGSQNPARDERLIGLIGVRKPRGEIEADADGEVASSREGRDLREQIDDLERRDAGQRSARGTL